MCFEWDNNSLGESFQVRICRTSQCPSQFVTHKGTRVHGADRSLGRHVNSAVWTPVFAVDCLGISPHHAHGFLEV